MGLFKRREKALTASGDALATFNSPQWNASPMLGGAAQQRIQNAFTRAQGANYGWMYTNSPAVRTVVDTIVRNVGQLEIRLYEEVGEAQFQPRPDHPAALSIRYPSETVSSDQLVRSLFKDYLIHDNAFALIVQGPGDRLQFIRLPAYMVQVMGPSLFEVTVYRVWPQGAWNTTGQWGGFGTPVDLDPSQVLHWHGEHPLDPRIGLSKLDTIRDVIAEDAALQQAVVELAQSGLQEPVWVKRPLEAPDISASALRELEQDLANRIIARNRKPPVLAEGMELQSFGISPQDAQMLEARKWAVERVCQVYGMPQELYGLGQSRTSALPAAQSALYTDVLLPICTDFTKFLDQRLLVRVYDWTDGTFAFNFDEKLMGDDRLTALTTASGRPVMLTNEARAKLNLPPVEGGDELVTPANVLVGNNPLPSQGVMPIQNPNGPPQDGSHRSGAAATQLAPAKALGWNTDPSAPIQQLHPRRDAAIQRQHRHIDAVQAVVQRHFNRLSRDLKAKARKSAEPDWARWDQEFATDLDREIKHIVEMEGALESMRMGGHTFDMGRVQHYVQAMAEGAATAINDTVQQEIKDLGIDNALARASQHVASAGTSLGVRSTIWAREEAARQSPDGGQGRIKTWVADTGRHAEFDGQTVPLEADWPAGFAPGSEPGCACTAVVT